MLRCVPRVGRVVCEIHATREDGTCLRRRAFPRLTDKHETPGRGLWLARALCDEVEIAEGDDGVVVRMTMTLVMPVRTALAESRGPEPDGARQP